MHLQACPRTMLSSFGLLIADPSRDTHVKTPQASQENRTSLLFGAISRECTQRTESMRQRQPQCDRGINWGARVPFTTFPCYDKRSILTRHATSSMPISGGPTRISLVEILWQNDFGLTVNSTKKHVWTIYPHIQGTHSSSESSVVFKRQTKIDVFGEMVHWNHRRPKKSDSH